MSLRTIIFWAHLCVGVCIGAVVLIMATTGVLLTYERQLTWWADTRAIDSRAPAAGAERLAPDVLIERARATAAGHPTALRYHAATSAPVEVQFGRERTLLLNGYTGEIVGTGSARARTFFRTVTDWHRWLGVTGEARRTARVITGVANTAFLFMLLSGLVLWFPRVRTMHAFRNALMFRRGLRPKARDFNWHHVIGFWSALPLALIIISATAISWAWAGNLVNRLERGAPAATAQTGARAAAPASTPAHGSGQLLARAMEHVPEWRSVTMQVPPRAGVYTFVIDHGTGGQPQKQALLTLSATGAELGWEPFPAAVREGRLRSILRYAHTGEVLGIAGQTLAGLVSAGTILLVWTGSALALRRFAASRRRASRSVASRHERRTLPPCR
jgi:uncharacterized iron-regulated membrane protein